MSTLTNRELEFIASLRTDWRRLYWRELARLLREDDVATSLRADGSAQGAAGCPLHVIANQAPRFRPTHLTANGD